MATPKVARANRVNIAGRKTGDATLWVNSDKGETLIYVEHGKQRLFLELPTKEWWKLLPSWANKPNEPSNEELGEAIAEAIKNGPKDRVAEVAADVLNRLR